MPVKTRNKQTKPKTVKLKQQKQLREIPQKNGLSLGKKIFHNMKDLYYSDQEPSEVKKQQEGEELLQEQRIKVEQCDQDEDSKIQDHLIDAKPVLKKGKKCKKQRSNTTSTALKSRSKKITNEIDKMDSISSLSEAYLELQKSFKSKSIKSGKIIPKSLNLMIPEEEPNPVQKKQINNVKDLRFEIGSKQNEEDYKKNLSLQLVGMKQKLDFDKNLQKDILQNLLGINLQNQKQLIEKFQQLKDYLFQKCKFMNQKELLQYRKTQQYRQIIQQLIRLHPYNSLSLCRPKKKLDLRINSAISQKFSFAGNNQIFHKGKPQLQLYIEPGTRNPIIQESKGNKYQNQEASESKNFLTKNSESKSSLSKVGSIKTKQRSRRKKDIEIEGKQLILTSIQLINYTSKFKPNNLGHEKKTGQPQVQSQYNKVKIQTNNIETLNEKSQLATNQIKLENEPDNHNQPPQPEPILQSNQPNVRLSQQSELGQKKSKIKTAEQRKKQAKQLVAKYGYRFHNWAETIKPAKKRLQILNRFQYNPFQLDNGEDQCELWKKLMADQFDDLRGKYKYEGPRDFFLRQPEDDYILPLRVKEEDFFISSDYNPKYKSITREKRQNTTEEDIVKKQEDSLDYSKQNSKTPTKIAELKHPKFYQGGLYIPTKQLVPKFDLNDQNCNYDFLEDLEVPSLPVPKQNSHSICDFDFL